MSTSSKRSINRPHRPIDVLALDTNELNERSMRRFTDQNNECMSPLPELRLDESDMSLVPPTQTSNSQAHSPGGVNLKLVVPKRAYSLHRDDSLERMETPMFDRSKVIFKKKGPSSTGTVLALSGLFVCGVMLVFSGIIVLVQHTETPFIVTGCLFLGIGFAMLIVCIALQRKNVVKFILDLNRDLYFLQMSDSVMWKLMFEERSQLPIASDT